MVVGSTSLGGLSTLVLIVVSLSGTVVTDVGLAEGVSYLLPYFGELLCSDAGSGFAF